MNKCSADVARRAAEEITLQTGKGHSLSLWHTHKFFDVLNSDVQFSFTSCLAWEQIIYLFAGYFSSYHREAFSVSEVTLSLWTSGSGFSLLP